MKNVRLKASAIGQPSGIDFNYGYTTADEIFYGKDENSPSFISIYLCEPPADPTTDFPQLVTPTWPAWVSIEEAFSIIDNCAEIPLEWSWANGSLWREY